MNNKLLLAALTAVLVVACASNPDKIAAAYVSPLKYRDYDCDQIAMEMDYVGQRTNRLYQNLKKENKADKWQMGVGMLLFWPTLFALEGGDGPEATEYAQLKGEFEALRTTSVQKKCGSSNRSFKQTVAEAQERADSQAQQVTQDSDTIAEASVQEPEQVTVAPPPPQTSPAVAPQPSAEKTAALPEAVAAPKAVKPNPVVAPLPEQPATMPIKAEAAPFPDDLVGHWGMSIAIKQGSQQTFVFDKGQISLVDPDSVVADFEIHDITFVLHKDPVQQGYLFTYSFRELTAQKPLLSLNEVPLQYAAGEGYFGSVTIGDDKLTLDVRITAEAGELSCRIEAAEGSGVVLEHHMSLWQEDAETLAGAAQPSPGLQQAAAPVAPAQELEKPATAAPAPANPEPQTQSSVVSESPVRQTVDPAAIVGEWTGKTSQGFDMSITTELVDGSPAVTAMQYDITLSGPAYSATTSMMQPRRVTARIEDGSFAQKGSDYAISGTFEGDTLKGKLSGTNVHPQGIGTATAEVTYVLRRAEATPTAMALESGVTIITGVLVGANGSPIADKRVEVLYGERYAVKFDNGILQNPTATSDENGRFEIKVNREKLTQAELEDLRLGVLYQPMGGMASQMAPLQNADGIPISLNVAAPNPRVDLGTITVN